MKILTSTNKNLLSTSALLLRIVLGVILYAIGTGKVFGWFGGKGLEPTIEGFAQSGIHPLLAYVSTFTELIGGFLVVIGLLTRFAAFAIAINMLVATIVSLPRGILMGGAAYPFTLFVISVVLLLSGPGIFSIDYLIQPEKFPEN